MDIKQEQLEEFKERKSKTLYQRKTETILWSKLNISNIILNIWKLCHNLNHFNKVELKLQLWLSGLNFKINCNSIKNVHDSVIRQLKRKWKETFSSAFAIFFVENPNIHFNCKQSNFFAKLRVVPRRLSWTVFILQTKYNKFWNYI